MKAFRNWWKIVLTVFICALSLVPIYVTLIESLKSQSDLTSLWVPPSVFHLENYVHAFANGSLARSFFNTIVITAFAVFLIVLFSAMAAYPLARNTTRANRVVTTFMLSILMVPGLSLLVPLYVLLVHVHGISTYWGMIAIHVTFNLPISIFLYMNFVRSLPRDFDEAALIDGSSVYAIFYRIILPLLRPVTVSVVILAGVAVWNDYQFSLYFLQKPEMRVITLSISSFFSILGTDAHQAAAAAVMAIVPITVIYAALQKYFVRGVLDSAIK